VGLAAPGGTPLESVQASFVDFGLTAQAARVLIVLLQQGSAVASKLATLSGLARPNVYPVLDDLAAKSLVMRVPGSAGVWTTPGWETVVERLYREQADRLEMLRARREEVLALVEDLSPAALSAGLPYVHVLQGVAENRKAYDHLLARSTQEILVCNKGPYGNGPRQANAEVFAALGRGVAARALYEHDAVVDPEPGWSAEVDAYHAAGVVGRVVDSLPLKMAVFDRSVSLMALTDPRAPVIGFPTVLLIEQPDLASVLAGSFDQLWAESQPYPTANSNLEGSRS